MEELRQLDPLVPDEAQLTGMVGQKDIPFLQSVPVDPRLVADGVRHGAKMARDMRRVCHQTAIRREDGTRAIVVRLNLDRQRRFDSLVQALLDVDADTDLPEDIAHLTRLSPTLLL